MQVHRVTGRLH